LILAGSPLNRRLRGRHETAASNGNASRSEKHRAIRESNRHDEILEGPMAMGKTCRSPNRWSAANTSATKKQATDFTD